MARLSKGRKRKLTTRAPPQLSIKPTEFGRTRLERIELGNGGLKLHQVPTVQRSQIAKWVAMNDLGAKVMTSQRARRTAHRTLP